MNAPLPPSDAPSYTPPNLARARKSLNLTLGFVLLLAAAFGAQAHTDWHAWAVAPQTVEGLQGLLGAPLLHGSLQHLVANATSLLILGTLAGTVYPRATLRALPVLWIGSGLGAWLWGDLGSHHLGASGLTHGLMFLLLGLAVLKRDRAALAVALIGCLFYGGMVFSVLPMEPGVSWQSHLGGGLSGLLAALLFRKSDPVAPPPRYSWDDENEEESLALAPEEAHRLVSLPGHGTTLPEPQAPASPPDPPHRLY